RDLSAQHAVDAESEAVVLAELVVLLVAELLGRLPQRPGRAAIRLAVELQRLPPILGGTRVVRIVVLVGVDQASGKLPLVSRQEQVQARLDVETLGRVEAILVRGL